MSQPPKKPASAAKRRAFHSRVRQDPEAAPLADAPVKPPFSGGDKARSGVRTKTAHRAPAEDRATRAPGRASTSSAGALQHPRRPKSAHPEPVEGRATRPPASAPRAERPRRGAGRTAPAQPAAAPLPTHPERIAKLLARAGAGSRRDIERYIAEGRVALHGVLLDTPATLVGSLEGVTLDNAPVAAAEATRLFRFHKPAGFLTAARDPGGRPTIYDALPPGLPRLVPVGRLDLNTEGLLLLTNDGELKRLLELPRNEVPRRYRVRAYGDVTQRGLESLMDGVIVDGVRYGPIDADLERRTGTNLWLTMTLREGKNREIRRVCEWMGLRVSRLIRTDYGSVALADLPPRAVDELNGQVIADLRRLATKPE